MNRAPPLEVVRALPGRAVLAEPDGTLHIGRNYDILRCSDDGASWEMVNLPYLGSMWGAAKTPGDCILIYGLRGHVMESCDFGMSWNEIETGIEASLSDYAEQDGIELFAGNSGTLLIRSDGRISDGLHSSGVDFSAVIPMGNGQFLLVGEDGVHYWPEPEGAAE